MDYLHRYWLTSQTVVGAVHFITASLGLLLGLGVLLLRAGSRLHKVAGYGFVVVLVVVNLSALFIHQLGFRWGPFHLIIPFSLWALYKGLRPFYGQQRPAYADRMRAHTSGMVAAALGLWAAFAAEFSVRTPALGRLLEAVPFDRVWVLTIEGFAIAFAFRYLIRIITRRQLRRLGLAAA